MYKIVLGTFITFVIYGQHFKPISKNMVKNAGIVLDEQVRLERVLNQEGALTASVKPAKNIRKKDIPLFREFPQLADTIPYVDCADLPTPITFINTNDCKQLLVKRDDLTGAVVGKKKLYGGNKVRKLEFLLAQAQVHGAEEVMTLGAAGSNHARATAVYAEHFGLQCTNFLKPQINSPFVQQNLYESYRVHAKLIYFPDNVTRKIGLFAEWLQRYQRTGNYPFVIPTGGSSPTGVLGFVNAAYELFEQIDAGVLEKPDIIYVASGTCGTVVGLMLGMQLLEKYIPIIAVATEPCTRAVYRQQMVDLHRETSEFLHTHDSAIPVVKFPDSLVTLNMNFIGDGYGASTLEGAQAQEFFKKHANIILDITYTSKSAAALLTDLRAGKLIDKTVLFWNTYSGEPVKPHAKYSYKKLPVCFHEYFE